MHQSGHSRAQSMQTVQFSSLSAITPRARGATASRSFGYWTVTAPRIMVMNVVFSPLANPRGISTASWSAGGSWGRSGMEGHLGDASDEDVGQREGNQELPRELLELVLAEAGECEPNPEDQETDEHDFGE